MSSVSNGLQKVTWDTIGIGASALCAIHCALLPFVLAFSPALTHFIPERKSFIAPSHVYWPPLDSSRSGQAYKVHRRKIVVVLLGLGIAGVTVGAYAGSWLPSHRGEVAISLVGSSFLGTGPLPQPNIVPIMQDLRRQR